MQRVLSGDRLATLEKIETAIETENAMGDGEVPIIEVTHSSMSRPVQVHSTPRVKSIESLESLELEAMICSFGEQKMSDETLEIGKNMHEMLQIRKKYVGNWFYPWETPTAEQFLETKIPEINLNYDKYGNLQTPALPYDPFDLKAAPTLNSKHKYEFVNGVAQVVLEDGTNLVSISFEEYFEDLQKLMAFIAQADARTFCFKRLKLLDLKFALHSQLHSNDEHLEQKQVPHRDFYNVRKVDTHVHLSSSMTQKHLLRFIKKKLKTCSNDVVITRDGKKLTLKQVFESLNITPYDLSVDTLDVHADKNMFHRFDKFNLKYNPMGQSRLREIFLKTDNEIGGKYFGELVGETFRDFEESKYQLEEPRVSIYGRKKNEWTELAEWINSNRLYSDNVRWLIQIPRLFDTHFKTRYIKSFQEMLDNIFIPLFEVTRDPSSNPRLHSFLQQVVGFDQVDDESLPEIAFSKSLKKPIEWTHDENPPYAYYAYYIYANLNVLNQFRAKQGLNTFAFRPHSGETGDVLHLGSAYLLTRGISHGIQLRKAPVLQYLYYLTQIGIAVSPLSNNFLFLNYDSNPFPQFFQRGLNVSLSTDDPLMFHFTREPLMEEYSVAAQVWQFSNSDLSEIARNSILQSGWEHLFKLHFLGEKYWLPGVAGNSIKRSNVPNLRMSYRHETLIDEHLFIIKCLHLGNYNGKFPVPLTLSETKKLIKREKAFALKSAEHIDNIAHLSSGIKPFVDDKRRSVDAFVKKGEVVRKQHQEEEEKVLLGETKTKVPSETSPFSIMIFACLFACLAIVFNLLFKVEVRGIK